MQSFSSFINESAREMRFINPEHGSTVFTLKTGGKHSYLYNSNHKNPTRVFTNMSETEIVSELKVRVSEMSNILVERAPRDPNAVNESELNNYRGKVNELAFLHYMREHIHGPKKGGTHPLTHLTPSEKAEHLRNASFLSHEEMHAQHKRAKAQVESFLEHAKINGYSHPTHVHHTAFAGDIGRVTGHDQSQTENPSDALVRFKKGPTQFLGASLKSSKKAEIGFHNGGAGVIGKSVGLNLEKIASEGRAAFAKKHGLASKDVARKKAIKADPELYDKALEAAGKLHSKIADTLHEHYSSMDPEHLRHHLVSTFLKSDEHNPVPYVKVTGRGGYGDKEAQAHTEHHHDNPVTNALLSAKRVTTRRSGAGMIHVLADGKHAFTIQAKHNSTPMSTSMKLVGQPATEVKNEAKAAAAPPAPVSRPVRAAPAPNPPVRKKPAVVRNPGLHASGETHGAKMNSPADEQLARSMRGVNA